MFRIDTYLSSLVKSTVISLITCFFVINVYSQNPNDSTILIISSYDAENGKIAENIKSIMSEYHRLGGTCSFVIEEMNCKSFGEANAWKDRMTEILNKYDNKNSNIILAILLGQEAWTSFISQDDEETHNIPIICGMVSRNMVVLPDDFISFFDWEPESLDLQDYFVKYKVISGYLYDYKIEENIELILDLYPNTENIALITDNSYGGVALQAYVKQKMKKISDLKLIPIDARKNPIEKIEEEISNLPENSVILLGTWRFDNDNNEIPNKISA